MKLACETLKRKSYNIRNSLRTWDVFFVDSDFFGQPENRSQNDGFSGVAVATSVLMLEDVLGHPWKWC